MLNFNIKFEKEIFPMKFTFLEYKFRDSINPKIELDNLSTDFSINRCN